MRFPSARYVILVVWLAVLGCTADPQTLAMEIEDASAQDANRPPDVDGTDAARPDVGNLDLGNLDLGNLDLGNFDLGNLDQGNRDQGNLDVTMTDAARLDGLAPDAERLDALPNDAVVPDGGLYVRAPFGDAFVDDGRCDGMPDDTEVSRGCIGTCYDAPICDSICEAALEIVTCHGNQPRATTVNSICPRLQARAIDSPAFSQSCNENGDVCGYGQCGPHCGNDVWEPQFGEECDDADGDPIDGCVVCTRSQTTECLEACDGTGGAPQAEYALVDEFLMPEGRKHALVAAGDQAFVARSQSNLLGGGPAGGESLLAVDAFRRAPNGRWSWSQQFTSVEISAMHSSSALAEMSDHVAVIAVAKRQPGCADPNLAVVFEGGSNQPWSLLQVLPAPEGLDCALTTVSLAVSDTMIVVSLNREIVEQAETNGTIVVFERDADAYWVETSRISPPVSPPGIFELSPMVGADIATSNGTIIASCRRCAPIEPRLWDLRSPVFFERTGDGIWQVVQEQVAQNMPPFFEPVYIQTFALVGDRLWLVYDASQQTHLRSLNRPVREFRSALRGDDGQWAVEPGALKMPLASARQSRPSPSSFTEDRLAASVPFDNTVTLFGRSTEGEWKREHVFVSTSEVRFGATARLVDDGVLVLVDHLDDRGLPSSTSLRHYRRTLRPACDAQGACICKSGWSGDRCDIAP